MAIGYQAGKGDRILRWRLVEDAADAGEAAPALATDGVSLRSISQSQNFPFEDVGAIVIGRSDTTKSVSVAAGARLLVYAADQWGPMGTGAAAARGLLNAGAACAHVDSFGIILCERITGLRLIERLAVYLPAITQDAGAGVFVDLVLDRLR